jgi:hypothetical protein
LRRKRTINNQQSTINNQQSTIHCDDVKNFNSNMTGAVLVLLVCFVGVQAQGSMLDSQQRIAIDLVLQGLGEWEIFDAPRAVF